MGYDPAGVPPEEEVLWTDAEFAAPSRDEMLAFQFEPHVGDVWAPGERRGRGLTTRPRIVVDFVPGGEEGRRLPRVTYQTVREDGSLGAKTGTYLSCFHAWARMHHCRPEAGE